MDFQSFRDLINNLWSLFQEDKFWEVVFILFFIVTLAINLYKMITDSD